MINIKTLYKRIALILIFALGVINITPTIQASINKTSDNSSENNTSIPNLNLSKQEIKLANEYIQNQINNGNIAMMPKSAVALAGSFFIPGVGQAVVTAAGVIIVGGAVVSVGSWLGKKVSDWIYNSKKNDAEKANSKIPKSLKKNNGNVDTDKFTHKVKGKQEWKNPKTGWSIEKDNANHRGYDGSVKTWKIKNSKGQRIGSLNSNGKVIDK